jgi:hypothetical protein
MQKILKHGRKYITLSAPDRRGEIKENVTLQTYLGGPDVEPLYELQEMKIWTFSSSSKG